MRHALFTICVCLAALFAPQTQAQERCDSGLPEAAARNAVSLDAMKIAVFSTAETGWLPYSALAAREIGTSCDAGSPAFAVALKTWQASHGSAIADGVMKAGDLRKMVATWQDHRSFMRLRKHDICPDAPPEDKLMRLDAAQSFQGRKILLQPRAMESYKALREAADRAGLIHPRAPEFTVFSAYRSPESDAARCQTEKNCNGVARAQCSNHRTGFALDIYVGALSPDLYSSTSSANRRFLVKSPAYVWMVANAPKYGFVNYPYEPWHWEINS